MKINKENIKRFTAGVVLTAVIGTPVGLVIGCKKTDHTKELCPITKVLNMLPGKNLDGYVKPLGAKHQSAKLSEDFYSEKFNQQSDDEEERLIVSSSYGKIIYPETFVKTYQDGTEDVKEVYENENGYFGGEYGITTNYSDGEVEYLVFEKTEVPEQERNFKLQKVVRTSR